MPENASSPFTAKGIDRVTRFVSATAFSKLLGGLPDRRSDRAICQANLQTHTRVSHCIFLFFLFSLNFRAWWKVSLVPVHHNPQKFQWSYFTDCTCHSDEQIGRKLINRTVRVLLHDIMSRCRVATPKLWTALKFKSWSINLVVCHLIDLNRIGLIDA